MTAETTFIWKNPQSIRPPFEQKLLLRISYFDSLHGRMCSEILTASICRTSSEDESETEPQQYDEYLAGPSANFNRFQFDLRRVDGSLIEDHCSDLIDAWAEYPEGVAIV